MDAIEPVPVPLHDGNVRAARDVARALPRSYVGAGKKLQKATTKLQNTSQKDTQLDKTTNKLQTNAKQIQDDCKKHKHLQKSYKQPKQAYKTNMKTAEACKKL